MSCWRLLFPLILILNITASAQLFPTPTPTPRPNSRQANLPPVMADNVNYDRLRSIEMMGQKDRAADHPLLDPKKGIYRRPSREEVAVLAVSDQLLSEYADFLRLPNTGIVKLNGDSSCISETDVIVASENCLVFKMPGAGTAYSFRTESYRIPRLADVILFNGSFMTGGVFQHVIMVEIGDVDIGSVNLESTKGMKYLVDLKTVRDSAEFMKFNEELLKGIDANGFVYRKSQPIKDNSVYLLRSIAYRGQYMRSIEGVQYDELEFDKRRDTIVAIRVVEIDAGWNVTIAWKRLKDTEAPKLRILK